MNTFRGFLVALLLAAAPLRGESARECVSLSAKIDSDVSSPSGVRVSVTARNRCAEDVDGKEAVFKVRALAAGGAVVGTQRGAFGGSIGPNAVAETKVFVVCDPDRVRSVSVAAD